MAKKENWRVYDEFLMVGALDRYTKLWARYELFKMVMDIPGDIVECGVLNGGGLFYWARMLKAFNNQAQRKVVGFDTFAGYPDSMKGNHDKKASRAFLKESQYKGLSAEKIMKAAARIEIDRYIELVPGDATCTIKEYVRKNPGFRAALINLDFDIYEPTRVALETLYPLLMPGGVVVFDEYAVHRWEESNAADDFFKDKKIILRTFPWAFSPTAYIIKQS